MLKPNELTLNLHLLKSLSNEQLINILEGINNELKVRLTVRCVEPTTSFDGIKPAEQPAKLLNRQQAIEVAKGTIEELKSFVYYRVRDNLQGYDCIAEFHVNKEKRAVTVLLKGFKTKVIRAKAVAKCDPNDAFNIHIGKAIALYRALGKTVPEILLNTPQPEGNAQIGDIVEYNGKKYTISQEWKANSNLAQPRSQVAISGKIVDDSNH